MKKKLKIVLYVHKIVRDAPMIIKSAQNATTTFNLIIHCGYILNIIAMMDTNGMEKNVFLQKTLQNARKNPMENVLDA